MKHIANERELHAESEVFQAKLHTFFDGLQRTHVLQNDKKSCIR